MPKDNPAFLYGQQYRPIGPASGQCLPEDTYIIGRVVLFWRPDEHQIRFAISAKYPSDVSTSAYTSTGSTATEKWKFMITLLPSASSLKSGQSAQEVIRAEYDAFLPYLGSEVKVAAEGLKVMLVNGKELHLEGSGARTMWTAKRGAWTVFQGRSPKLKGRLEFFWLTFNRSIPIIYYTFLAGGRPHIAIVSRSTYSYSTSSRTLPFPAHLLTSPTTAQPATHQ